MAYNAAPDWFRLLYSPEARAGLEFGLNQIGPQSAADMAQGGFSAESAPGGYGGKAAPYADIGMAMMGAFAGEDIGKRMRDEAAGQMGLSTANKLPDTPGMLTKENQAATKGAIAASGFIPVVGPFVKPVLSGIHAGKTAEATNDYMAKLMGTDPALKEYGLENPMPGMSSSEGMALGFSGGQTSKVGGALSGAAQGAVAGSVVPGIGTAIGAAVGGIAGYFSGRHAKAKAKERQKKAEEIVRENQQKMADYEADQRVAGASPTGNPEYDYFMKVYAPQPQAPEFQKVEV